MVIEYGACGEVVACSEVKGASSVVQRCCCVWDFVLELRCAVQLLLGVVLRIVQDMVACLALLGILMCCGTARFYSVSSVCWLVAYLLVSSENKVQRTGG